MAVRCALYLRHSTDKSKTENQKPDIEQVVRARGFEVVATFDEGASAVKKRPEYERMMKAAKRGSFDVLIVWALDRFGRSMVGNLTDVLELDRIGVKVISVRETWLDTGGPVRNLLVAIFSWVAEQERNRLVERTKAGVASARRRGARQRVAVHRRSSDPHARVVDPAHFEGLWRRAPAPVVTSDSPLEALGRSLADYEAALEVAS